MFDKTGIRICNMVLAVVLLFTVLPTVGIAAGEEEAAARVIYENTFDQGKASIVDAETAEGKMTVAAPGCADKELDGNMGICRGTDQGVTDIFIYTFTNAVSSGILSYSFDISRETRTEDTAHSYIRFNGADTNTRKVLFGLGVPNKEASLQTPVFWGPGAELSGWCDKTTGVEFEEEKIHHVQQIFDFDSHMAHTYIDGNERWTVTIPASLTVNTINIQLGRICAYFDNLKIEFLDDVPKGFQLMGGYLYNNTDSIILSFSEAFSAECAKENFTVLNGAEEIVLKSAEKVSGDTVRLVFENSPAAGSYSVTANGISSDTGVMISDMPAVLAVRNHVIYENDFNSLPVTGETIHIPNLSGDSKWQAEQDGNGNIFLKKVGDGTAYATLNNDFNNQFLEYPVIDYFAVSFDIVMNDASSGSTFLQISADRATDTNKVRRVFYLKKDGDQFVVMGPDANLVNWGKATGKFYTADGQTVHHVDLAYDMIDGKAYTFFDGQHASTVSFPTSNLPKVNIAQFIFNDNTSYLDNLKIYAYGGATQEFAVDSLQEHSSKIVLRAQEPIDPAITTDSFAVSEDGEQTGISAVTLSDGNRTATLTLDRAVKAGASYVITAKAGLKNFAQMPMAKDITLTAGIPMLIEVSEFKQEGQTITAVVKNNGTEPVTAVLLAGGFKDGILMTGAALDTEFAVDGTGKTVLDAGKTGVLSVTVQAAEGAKLKAFLWNSLQAAKPLCEPLIEE